MTDETHECPTCGDAFKTERGMKLHHSQIHGESIAGVSVECEWCGADFRVKRHRADDARFCTRECKGEWQSENRSGENSHMWEGGLVTTECDFCGSEMEKTNYKIETYEHNFCGSDCRSNWLSENHSGREHTQYERIETECEWCGDKLSREPSHAEKTDMAFCGHKCYGEWRSENKTGENNATFKGGAVRYYGPNWREQRRRARERDNHECRACGMSQEACLEEYGRKLDVHHITPFREFVDEDGNADYEAANDIDNLISLCQSCHKQYEGLPVVPRTAN